MLELICFLAGVGAAIAFHRYAAKSNSDLAKKVDAVIMGGGGPGPRNPN